jgi:glyoxylase-like metal-dependent hydrolase (beta-lactamase superfamily II)
MFPKLAPADIERRLLRTRIERDVAPGIHRIADGYVNWYLVEGDDGLTIVDCGLPRSWDSLLEALDLLGRARHDLKAILLTHAHYDHVGFARRAVAELGVPIFAAPKEKELARHPYRFDHERNPVFYFVNPKAWPIYASFAAAGAWRVKGVDPERTFSDGERLEVPGRPVVLGTPGHTHGHSGLHFEDRSTLIVGDALVTLDPYTGQTGPRLVARAATANVPQAMASLDRIGSTDATLLLPGHGEPFRGPAAQAAAQARANGSA